jgi:hypothetical protein
MRLLSESLASSQQAVAVRTPPNSEDSGLGDVETTPRPPQLLPGRLAAARQLPGAPCPSRLLSMT